MSVALRQAVICALSLRVFSHTAKVFLWMTNFVCEHLQCILLSFEAVVKNLPSGVHKLSVLVDNSFSEASALHVENDYQSYGGISRGVMLEQLPKHYIKQLHFTPVCKDDTWYAQLELVIASLDGKPWKGKVSVSLKGCDDVNENVLYTQSCSTGAGELVLKSDLIACENAKPWAPEHPTLYMLSAQLEDEDGKVIDDLTDRVGFREVRTQGKDILLNGKKLQIKGFCRHEDHPQFGCRCCRFLQLCRTCNLHEIWEQIQLEHLIIQMMSCFLICVMSLVFLYGRKTMQEA